MYRPILCYTSEGDFIGCTIMEQSAQKLQTTNLYASGEEDKLEKALDRLNNQQTILSHWPASDDPEVKTLLEDETWEPIEREEVEILDEAASYVAYHKVTEFDPITGKVVLDHNGMPKLQDGDIDTQNSSLVYRTVYTAVRPTDETERFKKACEAVAVKRASASAIM